MKCKDCNIHLRTKIENNKLITYCPKCNTEYKNGTAILVVKPPKRVRRSK